MCVWGWVGGCMRMEGGRGWNWEGGGGFEGR